jgi:hypothetical protein
MIARSEVAALRSELRPLSAWTTLLFLVFGVAVRWLAFAVTRNHERTRVFRAVLRGYLAAILGRDRS